MNSKVDILILGGGIAGLGASMAAERAGREAIVFEASSSAGGLLDHFEIEGFFFDNAVHLSFASEPEVREIFDKTPYLIHSADSVSFDNGTWLKHPVQNNLSPLSAEEKVKLIRGVIDRPAELASDNFEDWLRHQYGNPIAERYPLRYTRKYWQTGAELLSTTWIGNRMRQADINEILFGAFTSETPNTYYIKEMRYPKTGGFRSFIDPLICGSKIYLNHKAIRIDLNDKIIFFENGLCVAYNDLVSSIPLPVFVNICKNVDKDVQTAAGELAATSMDLVSIGFGRDIIKDLWFYIYDEDILASRAYSPSVKSKNNAPVGCSSLQFEIYNPGRTSQHKPQHLKENTKYALKKMKICGDDDILFLHHKFIPWANVVFFKNMEKYRSTVLSFLKHYNVFTCGRFGEWDYLWSNQALMSGIKLDFSKKEGPSGCCVGR